MQHIHIMCSAVYVVCALVALLVPECGGLSLFLLVSFMCQIHMFSRQLLTFLSLQGSSFHLFRLDRGACKLWHCRQPLHTYPETERQSFC